MKPFLNEDEHALACPHCLDPHGVTIRFDKKSRPFTRCSGCGSMAFLRGRASMAGFAILGPEIEVLSQRRDIDPTLAVELQRKVIEFIKALSARLEAPALPASSAPSAPQAAEVAA